MVINTDFTKKVYLRKVKSINILILTSLRPYEIITNFLWRLHLQEMLKGRPSAARHISTANCPSVCSTPRFTDFILATILLQTEMDKNQIKFNGEVRFLLYRYISGGRQIHRRSQLSEVWEKLGSVLKSSKAENYWLIPLFSTVSKYKVSFNRICAEFLECARHYSRHWKI